MALCTIQLTQQTLFSNRDEILLRERESRRESLWVLLILGERLGLAGGSHSGNCSKRANVTYVQNKKIFLLYFLLSVHGNVLDVYMRYKVLYNLP